VEAVKRSEQALRRGVAAKSGRNCLVSQRWPSHKGQFKLVIVRTADAALLPFKTILFTPASWRRSRHNCVIANDYAGGLALRFEDVIRR